MAWLNRIFGGHKEKAPPPTDEATTQIRKEIEDNLDLLQFLVTCGPFNKEKLQTYFALCSQHGKQYDLKGIIAMENADQMIGGFETLRSQTLVPGHLEAWRTFFDLLAKMRPTPETGQYLEEAMRRFDKIQAQIGKAT